MTLEEMMTQRDALLAARYRGLRMVEIEGRRVTFATDAEMAAITDLERRIAAAQDGGRKHRILTSASKGRARHRPRRCRSAPGRSTSRLGS